jgi:hypothetical protein
MLSDAIANAKVKNKLKSVNAMNNLHRGTSMSESFSWQWQKPTLIGNSVATKPRLDHMAMETALKGDGRGFSGRPATTPIMERHGDPLDHASSQGASNWNFKTHAKITNTLVNVNSTGSKGRRTPCMDLT